MTLMKRRDERAEVPRATKKTIQTTINQNKAGCGDTSRHPLPPFSTQAKMPKEIEKEHDPLDKSPLSSNMGK